MQRRPSVAAEALVSNDDSLLLKSAFLMYQRVGLSHDIAQNYRHHDYEKTVSSSLQKLEAQRKKKLELTERLNAMEADVARRKQEFEAVTRRLNEIFGNVLSSVETVHKSLLGTHNVLRSKYAEVAARVPLRDEDRSLALNFSLALGFCNAGLVVDGPLKRQLEDLELRESQGASELAELEDKLKRLQSESDNLKGTKAEMEVVVNVSARKGRLFGLVFFVVVVANAVWFPECGKLERQFAGSCSIGQKGFVDRCRNQEAGFCLWSCCCEQRSGVCERIVCNTRQGKFGFDCRFENVVSLPCFVCSCLKNHFPPLLVLIFLFDQTMEKRKILLQTRRTKLSTVFCEVEVVNWRRRCCERLNITCG